MLSAAVARFGLLGVFVLMVPESACVPVPSELTLVAAGVGVHQGWLSFPAAVAAATAGNLVGSLIAYSLGRRGVLARLPGRAEAVVRRCEALFGRYGPSAVFIARLLPLARTFVSLPAGHADVPLGPFILLTIAGCAIWSAALILVGTLVGTSAQQVAGVLGQVSVLVLAVLVLSRAMVRKRRSGAHS
jgi:membrane protein DedA with SNARE-associated domain